VNNTLWVMVVVFAFLTGAWLTFQVWETAAARGWFEIDGKLYTTQRIYCLPHEDGACR
jgi:hypothetical protein